MQLGYVNFNGEIVVKDKFSLELSNRAFRFGDSIFETIRVFEGKIIFIEDHFNRLKNSLEVVRIHIPKTFTKDFLESEILKLVDAHHKNANARIRVTIFRKASQSIYFVDANDKFDYVIEYSEMIENNFSEGVENYKLDIYDEIRKPSGKLSQIKSNNVLLHSIAGSVAKEKQLDNILLINEKGFVTEAVNANIFGVKNGVFYTPKLSDGCVDGIMRKNIITLINGETNFKVEEKSITKIDLLNFDEVFLTNSIIGIQPIKQCQSVVYSDELTKKITIILIESINLKMGQKGN